MDDGCPTIPSYFHTTQTLLTVLSRWPVTEYPYQLQEASHPTLYVPSAHSPEARPAEGGIQCQHLLTRNGHQ